MRAKLPINPESPAKTAERELVAIATALQSGKATDAERDTALLALRDRLAIRPSRTPDAGGSLGKHVR
jgi:hypothetical protein